MRLWRICREPYAAEAFSGEGSKRSSGRWHTKGTAVAYTAESLALAALEVFVHLAPGIRPQDLVAVAAELPVEPTAWEREKQSLLTQLSRPWQFRHEETRAIGNAWATKKTSLLLPVPSVVIPREWNVLFNPEHPTASKLKVVETIPFQFDPRMFK